MNQKNYSSEYQTKKVQNYWDHYYQKKKSIFTNSDFSKFVNTYLTENSSIIDLGCGDGRDSIFFSKNKIYTEGFDISAKAIQANKKYENKFLKFSVIDIDNIKELNKTYDFAYCRFLFHAINEDLENILLFWLSNNITKKIFIETRILDEHLLNSNYDHYRRNFSQQDFIDKLKKYNFEITFLKASREFSKYKSTYNVSDLNHDPLLLRVVLSK